MSRTALLGLFVFGALVILLASVFMIGDRQLMFSRTYRLHSQFSAVSGLMPGGEVRVGGVRMGTVQDIRLPDTPTGKVVVTMALQSSTRSLIKKDSVAAIETEGLLGNKFVAVAFGSDQSPRVQDGDTIPSQPPVDLSDLIAKTNQIMDTAHAALKNVDQATGQMASITSKVDRGEGTIGALINDKSVYRQLDSTMTNARVGLTAFQEDMQALKRNWFFRGFFRNRGYMDSTELTKHEIKAIPAAAPAKKFLFAAKDLFDSPDAAKLKNKKKLAEVGTYLQNNRFGVAVVAAYSGPAGDKDENLVRTQAQAMVVRDYLADNFELDDSRLKTKGLGEAASQEKGRERWIEVLVYPENPKLAASRK
jgi:outer membrane protein OmpA-like peptidoglycan-associated protein